MLILLTVSLFCFYWVSHSLNLSSLLRNQTALSLELSVSVTLFICLCVSPGTQHASGCCHSWCVLDMKHEGKVCHAMCVLLCSFCILVFVTYSVTCFISVPVQQCWICVTSAKYSLLYHHLLFKASWHHINTFNAVHIFSLSFSFTFYLIQSVKVALHFNQFYHIAASPYLYYRPVVRLPQQLNDSRNPIVQSHSILGQLCVLVPGGEVAQSADCWLSNILLLPSTKHSMNQCLHTTILSHQSLRDNR